MYSWLLQLLCCFYYNAGRRNIAIFYRKPHAFLLSFALSAFSGAITHSQWEPGNMAAALPSSHGTGRVPMAVLTAKGWVQLGLHEYLCNGWPSEKTLKTCWGHCGLIWKWLILLFFVLSHFDVLRDFYFLKGTAVGKKEEEQLHQQKYKKLYILQYLLQSLLRIAKI